MFPSNVNMQMHNQWAYRPKDQAYQTLDPIKQITLTRWQDSTPVEFNAKHSTVHLEPNGLYLNDNLFNYYSLDQFAAMLGVSSLPTQGRKDKISWRLQAEVYNEAMSKRDGKFNGLLLGGTLRAINTTTFARIPDYQLVDFFLNVRDGGAGWMHPTSAKDGYRGLYLSEHDVWLSIFNETLNIDDGSDGGVHIGIMGSNSEVGNQKALKIQVFGYRYVCQNHMIWGYEEKLFQRIIHKGDTASEKWIQARDAVKGMTTKAQSEYARIIELARRFSIGKTHDEAVKWLTKHEIAEKRAVASINYNVQLGIDPTNLYNAYNGLTAITHENGTDFADVRFKRDAQAAKILAYAR